MLCGITEKSETGRKRVRAKGQWNEKRCTGYDGGKTDRPAAPLSSSDGDRHNVFQQLYNLSDSIIVGRFFGPDALAAVGSTNAISFFFFSIAIGLSVVGAAYTSQSFGAGHTERVV
ncbi:MATE family efflux transporter [Lachnoclostridium sp. Marseille-P6806]|uniref:MATE family efflux transporter n=1 Tax=Lachnoclostridium sp. Marseille-P6806 TaxID=2364793 RepID=UPI001F5EBEC3|nr:MATE family efflux transporter [Lachnoclostridium sp. Marseille-P6806]